MASSGQKIEQPKSKPAAEPQRVELRQGPKGPVDQQQAAGFADPKLLGNQAQPKPVGDHGAGGLEVLMALEGRVRETKSEVELVHFVVNETRKLTGARQVFLFQGKGGKTFKPKAVSSMAMTDPDSPMLRWVTKIVHRLEADANIGKPIEFRLPSYADSTDEETKTYPFKHFFWQPLRLPSGEVFAGILQTRESGWQDSAFAVTKRLAVVYAHTWAAHVGPRRLNKPPLTRSWIWPVAATVLSLCMLIPVPMTVLAPVEVVAEKPFVVAAPIDGIIKEIVVDPNSAVKPGTVLFKFDDTTARNKAQLAARELSVAEAAYQKAAQGAFTDPKARHQLAIAKAEVELKRADYKYASEVLNQSVVTASTAGVVIAADKDQWKGRPVATGEQILKIADPGKVALRIDLPVADSIVLKENARVRVFLDSQPLQAIEAEVTRASYQGKPTSTNQLAYEVRGKLKDAPEAERSLPRIGARGTAQVYGDDVSLGFYLFRRPIAAVRQYIGL